MLVKQNNVTQYIPQRAPFIMVDALLEKKENSFKTNFKVRENNIFLEDNYLKLPALIENIAQSAALGLGFSAQRGDESSKVGFIGSISDLMHYNSPKLNQIIETQITIIQEVFNIILISGESYTNNQKLVSCKMKIALT